jgi:hypothetical protein
MVELLALIALYVLLEEKAMLLFSVVAAPQLAWVIFLQLLEVNMGEVVLEVVLEVASHVAVAVLLLTQELLEQVVSSLSLSFLRDRD